MNAGGTRPQTGAQTPEVLVLAPGGRDARLATAILAEAGIAGRACADVAELHAGLDGAAAALVTEEALATADLRPLLAWIGAQPPWSDFPFILLARHGSGLERNPQVDRFNAQLRNVAFLERPFHPTTLVSVVRSAVGARRRQHEARAAIEDAARSADRLRFALLAGRLGAWEFDATYRTLDASDAFKAVFGRAPGDRFGFAELLDAVHPDDRDRLREAFAPAGTEDRGVECATIWPDGSLHWAELRGRATRGAGGRRLVAGVALDTTERRGTEEALRRHRERLEDLVAERTRALEESNLRLRQAAEERDRAEAALLQAQKMDAIGQLTGGLAHDFNNLLQAVLGSFDMVRRRAADPTQVERIAAAGADAARRGAKLTAQLLAFSRKQKLDLAPVAVAWLVDGMRDLLTRALGHGIELRLELDMEAGAALADATQLELAVLNLAINARDAMPQGGAVTVAVRQCEVALSAELAAGRYVVIEVSDTGEGMPPEVATRAFEPFFTTKGVGKGTGLGLSQVYGIARQCGGAARIRSAPGAGTTVTILLPAAPGEAAGPAKPDAAPEAPAAPVGDRLVLVVDDDPAVRRALAGWLDTLGYRVAEAADGRSGLDALDSLAPDAMLVDYAMPGLTGTEVAAAARARRPGLPIVLATGYSSDAALDTLPTLRKPFRIEDLAEVLDRALARPG